MLGFAVAGLVLGHVLSYVIAMPDPYHRHLLLQRTGHHYLPAFGQAGISHSSAASFQDSGGSEAMVSS